jgi:type II secretory pathway component PulF
MTLYVYKGLTTTGVLVKGQVSASSTTALNFILKQQDIRLIHCYPKFLQRFLWVQPKPRHEELLEFFHHMSHMMRAGIGLIEALEAYPATPKSKDILEKISLQVQQGFLLSECISLYPSFFNKLTCSLIQIAEKNGDLVSVFEKIRLHLIWKHKVTTQFVAAIRYPFFLLCLTFSAFLFLMGTVAPQLQTFLHELHAELSLGTRILLESIAFFKTYGFWILFFSVLCFLFFYSHFRVHFQEMLYRVPLFGKLFKNFYVAQLSEQISLMMETGIPLMEALQISTHQMQNEFFKSLLTKVISQVQQGSCLSRAFQTTPFFPVFFLHVVRTGESSDTLLESFKNIHLYYSEKTDDNLTRLSEFLHPLCLLFIGAFLIWMVLGIFYPLYESLALVS